MEAILIKEDGHYEYHFDVKENENITIEVSENVHAYVLVHCKGNKYSLTKNVTLYPNSVLHMLYHNEATSYESVETIKLYENANMQVGYYELEACDASIKADYYLEEREANVNITTTTLARNTKEYTISAHHVVGNTYSNMENYAMNDIGGTLQITASGAIEKGAKGSKSHQSTRVLTKADKEKVSVTPLLLIDENDVEASHACGIGEMNEDHLYYLQTRGLTKDAALGLLTLSYVLPILNVVEDWEEMHTRLNEDIQRKVGLA